MSRLKKIYLYCCIFGCIYIEFGYQMVVANQILGFTRMLLLLILTAPLLLFEHKVQKSVLICFIAIVSYITVNSLRDDSFSDYIFLMIPIFVGFVLATSIKIEIFVRIYGDIMLFLSIFSLGIYGINLVLPAIIQKLPFIGNVYTYSAQMHNALFAVAITNSENIRNYGIAWEPGAFSFLLCIALIFEVTFYAGINYKRFIIFIITIVTTFSTTGYFALVGILYSCFFYKRKLSKKEKNILLIVLIMIMVFVLYAPDSITALVFSKLKGLFSGGTVGMAYTTQTRINAIKYPMQAFLNSPLIGVGFEQFMEINRIFCDSMATNTVINWFAVLGVFFGLPCCIGLFSCLGKIAKRIHAPKMNVFILCAVMILLLATESLLRISLVYVLIFWGFQRRKYVHEIRKDCI